MDRIVQPENHHMVLLDKRQLLLVNRIVREEGGMVAMVVEGRFMRDDQVQSAPVGFAENVRNNRLAGKSSRYNKKWIGVLGMVLLVGLLATCVWEFVLLPKIHRSQRADVSTPVRTLPPALAAKLPQM